MTEPLHTCGACGFPVYRSRPCRYINVLHDRPAYLRHEESA